MEKKPFYARKRFIGAIASVVLVGVLKLNPALVEPVSEAISAVADDAE